MNRLTEDDLFLYLCLDEEVLFLLLFWQEELTIEMSPEQKLLALDRSKQVFICSGRKTAKTILIESKVIRWSLLHEQSGAGTTEALLFTPRENHLNPLLDRIIGRIERTPFLKSLFPETRRGESPRILSAFGLTWYARIEGVAGTDQNMVGLRAAYMVGDELAFGNFVCHRSRLQTALPDCQWFYAGVPNGVRTTPFYLMDTGETPGWSKHKYSTFANPLYQSAEAKKRLLDEYGGENTQGYVTQVLGLWGDEFVSSFPPGAIAMRNHPYFTRELGTRLQSDPGSIALACGLPTIRGERFAIGWDYGFSPDPSVIMVAVDRGNEVWETIVRLTMRQVPEPTQVMVAQHLYHNVLAGQLGSVSCDNLIVIQTMRNLDPDRAHLFHKAEPGGWMPVQNIAEYNELGQRSGKPETMRIKQLLTDRLRSWMINANLGLPGTKLWLGHDPEVENELAGTTEKRGDYGVTYFGPQNPENSRGMFDHIVDSLRYMTHSITLSQSSSGPDEQAFLDSLGWAGSRGAWKAPWDNR